MPVSHLRRKIIVNFFFQLLTKMVARLFYRIHVEGKIDVPAGKGVLLIANHISFVDFIIVGFILPLRRTMFGIMDWGIYHTPRVNAIVRHTATVPIASKKISLEAREKSFESIRNLLAAGHWILFFPEGVVTHDGQMSPFQYGLERIRKESPDSYIVPIAINGLQGGFFSRVGGLFNRKKFRREWRRSIDVKISKAIPANRWEISHFETKVKLMLRSMGNDGVNIECLSPLQLPSVRTNERIPFSDESRKRRNQAKFKFQNDQSQDRTTLVLIDYSPYGLCVEVKEPITAETILELSFEQLNAANLICQVRWCRETEKHSYLIGLKLIDKHEGDQFIDLKISAAL